MWHPRWRGLDPGRAPLVEIGDPLNLEVVADLLSTDATQIEKGAAVRIDGWGGTALQVTRVDPAGFSRYRRSESRSNGSVSRSMTAACETRVREVRSRRYRSWPERRGLRPEDGPFVEDGHLFTIIEEIDEIAREAGKSVTQIALNWLLQRPTVASLIIGAPDETQLSENFGAIGWALTPDQVQRLDKASRVIPTYPYWHQEGFAERNPFPTL
jgi:Aldo/keto reductase family